MFLVLFIQIIDQGGNDLARTAQGNSQFVVFVNDFLEFGQIYVEIVL